MGHVGVIDAGIRDDHAQAMLGDDQAGPKAQDLAGFGQDHLHQGRVLARGGRELRARGDGVTSASETYRPSAFETILWVTTSTSPRARRQRRGLQRVAEDAREIVAGPDRRDARYRRQA